MTQLLTLQINYDDVRKTLTLFHSDSKCFEIRILNVKRGNYKGATYAGFFNSVDAAIEAIKGFEKENFTYSAIYFTLNPVNESLLARSFNRLKVAEGQTQTSDKDIVARKWMLVDFDSERVSGISASDTEKRSSQTKALHVAETLCNQGWPTPVVADSGNGYHLLYRIDEPVEDNGLIKGVLEGLHVKFFEFDKKVKVDATNFNPARIDKLYGTPACKGDSTPDRPHRMSRIFDGDTEVVSTALLQSEFLAVKKNDDDLPDNAEGKVEASIKWLLAWAFKYSVELKESTGNLKHAWNLICPFNTSHGHENDTQIYVLDNGAFSFKCQHASCIDYKWKQFRGKVEATHTPSHNKPILETVPEVKSVSFEDYRTDVGLEVKKFVNIGPLQKTGIEQLDECIGGIARGKFFILNGAPQAGKSAATTQMLTELTKNNFVVYYPVDEGTEELLKRMARQQGLDNDEMRIPSSETKVNVAIKSHCNHNNLFIINKKDPLLTIDQVLALAEQYKPADLPLIVFIDSLHSLSMNDEQDNLRLFYTTMCATVENWTKRTGAIFIGVVEQNRGGYASSDPKNRTAAIGTSAESRAFEFKADYLIVMNVDMNTEEVAGDEEQTFKATSVIKWTVAKIRGLKKSNHVFSKFDNRRTMHYTMDHKEYEAVKKVKQERKDKFKEKHDQLIESWLFNVATWVIRNTPTPITSMAELEGAIRAYGTTHTLVMPEASIKEQLRIHVKKWEKEKVLERDRKTGYKVLYDVAGQTKPSDFRTLTELKADSKAAYEYDMLGETDTATDTDTVSQLTETATQAGWVNPDPYKIGS